MTGMQHQCLAGNFYSVGVGAPRAAASAKLSSSLSFLEHLTMDIAVVSGCSNSRLKKQFPMTVHHKKTKASWRHCHSYEDYRLLQERLLELMEQGHFCMAECPWLYTFLQRSFPKPPPMFPFGLVGSDRSAQERRFALLRTIGTLQSVLLNPNNHSCDVLTNAVATELVGFLYGEQIPQQQQQQPSVAMASPVIHHPWETSSPIAGDAHGFSVSINDDGDSSDNTETTDSPHISNGSSHNESKVCCAMCAVKAHHPEEQVLATWSKHTHGKKGRSSSLDTTVLSQDAETPRDSYPASPGTSPFTPPPFIPENAILSPPRHYRSKEPSHVKRFSLAATTASMFYSLRQRVLSPVPGGSYSA